MAEQAFREGDQQTHRFAIRRLQELAAELARRDPGAGGGEHGFTLEYRADDPLQGLTHPSTQE